MEEIGASLPSVFATTTCSQKGYGYDESAVHHGAWTNAFLEKHLVTCPDDLDLADIFQRAYHEYLQTHTDRGDRPCCVMRTKNTTYDTNQNENAVDGLPRGVFTLSEMFG